MKLAAAPPNSISVLSRHLPPRPTELTWNGEVRATTPTKTGVPQGSPLSPVLVLIGVAGAIENADNRIPHEIPSHQIKTYSYVDDFNCTARSKEGRRRRGRGIEAITAARKARHKVSEELERSGWTRDLEKDARINFGAKDGREAKWVGIIFTSDLSWKKHNNRRLNQAEAA